jgi:hypothetical protein
VRPGEGYESNEQLLTRIQNLERILETHAQLPSPVSVAHGQPTPTSLATDVSHYSLDQNDASSVKGTSPAPFRFRDNPPQAGILKETQSGHVRYEPRASQWSSVLNGSRVEASTETFNDVLPTGQGNFPFSTNPTANIEDFLTLLPPSSQCDELKATFFNVFSPVCFVHGPVTQHELIYNYAALSHFTRPDL